jgi:hypothetical protein
LCVVISNGKGVGPFLCKPGTLLSSLLVAAKTTVSYSGSTINPKIVLFMKIPQLIVAEVLDQRCSLHIGIYNIAFWQVPRSFIATGYSVRIGRIHLNSVTHQLSRAQLLLTGIENHVTLQISKHSSSNPRHRKQKHAKSALPSNYLQSLTKCYETYVAFNPLS